MSAVKEEASSLEGAVTKRELFWNFAGSFMFALSTVILSAVAKRAAGETEAGLFVIAMTLAQTLINVGYFETRTFQVTDVSDRFSFGDYFTFRILCAAAMMACAGFVVVFGRESGLRAGLILALCAYKMLDTVADVFECHYQRCHHIELTGKSLFFRNLCSTIAFSLASLVTKNLITGILLAMGVQIVFLLTLNPRYLKQAQKGVMPGFACHDLSRLTGLFKSCVMLAAGAFMCGYIFNAPKYAVDLLCPEDNYRFSAVFMPLFVINLFAGILFRPYLTGMAEQYQRGDDRGFFSRIGLFYGGCGILTLVCLAGAWLLGIPVLSAIYGVDLSPQKDVMLLLVLAGGLNACGILTYYVLTIIRVQGVILIDYTLVFILSLFLPKAMTEGGGLKGAALSCVILMAAAWCLFFLTLCIMRVLQQKRRQ